MAAIVRLGGAGVNGRAAATSDDSGGVGYGSHHNRPEGLGFQAVTLNSDNIVSPRR